MNKFETDKANRYKETMRGRLRIEAAYKALDFNNVQALALDLYRSRPDIKDTNMYCYAEAVLIELQRLGLLGGSNE